MMQTMLFGVEPTDPMAFAVVVTVFGLVALTASILPARGAARVDPPEAIRTE